MLKTLQMEKEETKCVVEARHLTVNFDTVEGRLNALDDVSIKVRPGETLGILGESGSGKSTLALALMGMLPENATVSGEALIGGEVVSSPAISGRAFLKLRRRRAKKLSEKLRNIRWKEVSMVFQGAMNAFNPVYTIRRQIAEVFRIHTNYSEEKIERKVVETIKRAGLNPVILDSYPHELSGGMKQRAVLAMALALDPTVVIADEPTTGLDVITQANIIAELKHLIKEQGKSMIIISHDIGVVAQLADRVVVLYAGRVMETGTIDDIYLRPSNPYTRSFLDSYPSIMASRRKMSGIPGSPPDPISPPRGCRFNPRCKFAQEICSREEPPLVETAPDHFSRCHFALELHESGEIRRDEELMKTTRGRNEVVVTQNLTKYFDLRSSLAGRIFSRESSKRLVRAVDHVSLNIIEGEILGIVGESGSGKTTLGRTLIGLIRPTGGTIKMLTKEDKKERYIEISEISPGDKAYDLLRESTQMIFQDPYDSLDPKMTIFDIVREPLIAHKKARNPQEAMRLVSEALSVARLSPPENFLNRYPHELSGGERQRVAAARALVLRPELLVADEPISMLDVSLRAGFLNLLLDLRDRFGMTIVYITHDIASARYVSDRILVMYLGVAVEMGLAEEVIKNPLHPYTRALIQAVPAPTPKWNPGKLEIIGEIGNAVDVPRGCRFYDRCKYRRDICKNTPPPTRTESDSGHWYVCHFPQEELTRNASEQSSEA
ncbi:MAG: ABC transporter ATP-binding protein [Methanomassiliicoccales archaeon]